MSSDAVREYDAVVIGGGASGVAAALALKQQGKFVAVAMNGSGATSVSSGALSFDSSRVSKEAAASCEWFRDQLKPFLPLALHWDEPVWIPSTNGFLLKIHAAQQIQADAGLQGGKPIRIAMATSRRWRIRGDLLCGRWNEAAKALGLSATFQAMDLPLEGEGWDIPLTRVSADLAVNSVARERLGEAISRLGDSMDRVLLPPLLPNQAAIESVKGMAKIFLGECLATVEPIPGFRLYSAMQAALEAAGIERIHLSQMKVQPSGDRLREFLVVENAQPGWTALRAKVFVLATGHLFGGGVRAHFRKAVEPILNLPLHASASGRVGVKVDAHFRPLAEDGRPAFQNLHACGGLLFSEGEAGLGTYIHQGRHCADSFA